MAAVELPRSIVDCYRLRMRLAVTLLLFAPALAACSSGGHAQVTSSAEASVPYPDPPDGAAVTWDNWVSGFSNIYCVSCHNPNAACGGSGCHTASDPELNALLFDMRDKSAWTARASTIKCGIAVTQDVSWYCSVAPETYPKMGGGNPLPTDAARGTIVGWIAAGAP